MNRRGKQVVDRMAFFEQAGVREYLPDESADWFSAGSLFAQQLRDAVHGELDPATVAEAPIRYWQASSREVLDRYGVLRRRLNDQAAQDMRRRIEHEAKSGSPEPSQ